MLSVEVEAPYPHAPNTAEIAILGEWPQISLQCAPS